MLTDVLTLDRFKLGTSSFCILYRLLLLPLLLFLLGATAPALADPSATKDAPGHADFLVDSDGALSVEDVSSDRYANAFRPMTQADLRPGYNESTFWVRLTPPRGEWLLEVTYPHLDRVNLYAPRDEGGFHVSRAGDKLPFAARALSYHNPLFRVRQDGRRTYFLEIRTSGSTQLSFRLWDPEAFDEHAIQHRFVVGVYLGGMAAMAFYNLFLLLATRDRTYFYYITYICAYLLFQASMSGYSYQYLWPDSPYWTNKSIPLLLGLAVAAALQFSRCFLATWRTMPAFDRMMKAVLLAALACAPLVFILPYIRAAQFANLVAFSLVLVVVPAAYLLLIRGHQSARFFVTAWTVFLLGIFIYAAVLAGFLPQNAFTVNAMPIGAIVEVILLSFALADRINALRRDKELQQTEFNSRLQQLNEQLELKVVQRTRELASAKAETELANQELARQNATLEAMASHDALTGLLNRRSFCEQAGLKLADARQRGHPLSVVMLDLDHFKLINDQYGHQTGDEVLRGISRLIMSICGSLDLAARYGGDEFILLLPYADELEATDRAARLIERIEATDFGAPVEPALSASAGVATASTEEWGLDGLVRIADQRLYEAKNRRRRPGSPRAL